jgi:Ca2+-binding EF-hand superfamily protein
MRIRMAGAGKALIASLLPVSLAATALLPASTATAQQKPPATAPATPAAPAQSNTPQAAPADPDALAPALAEFDTNKDKAIDQKEFVTSQMKTFDEVDANKDGAVTREEYLKQAEPPFVPADTPNLPPIEERRRLLNLRFTNLDSNQDGKISREEAEQSFVREFVIMDRDQNGRVTAHDLRLARAQAQQQQQQQNPGAERLAKQDFIDNEVAIFERLDTNKDKSIVLEEFLTLANGAPADRQEQAKANLTAAFGEIDTSKDKKLSEAEWKAAAERNFAQADRNKDGVLTTEEIRPPAPPQAPVEETRAQFVNGRVDELMTRLDKNKDGKISLPEFLALTSDAPPAQADQANAQLTSSFNAMDANKNASVERSELVTHFTTIFNRIDANKDGKITQREMNAAGSQQQQPRPQAAPTRPAAPAPAPQAAPKPAPKPAAPKPQPAPQPAPQGGPPPAYPSGGQAPITTTPGSQPLR